MRVSYGAPVFALILIAAAALPRALPDAEAVTFVPRLDAVPGSLPFLNAAGSRVALLRPSSWREFTHPILRFDLTSVDSLTAAGIDATGALTLSRRGDLEVACVSVSDVKVYETACETKLKSLGVVSRANDSGAVVVSTKDQLNRVLLAYAIKGKVSCAAQSHGLTLQKVLPELAKLVSSTKPPVGTGFKTAAELPGIASLIRPNGAHAGAVSLTTHGFSATLAGQVKGFVSSLAPKVAASPFAKAAPQGLGVLRLQLAQAHLTEAIDSFLGQTPGGVRIRGLAQLIAPLMTGNVLVFVHRVEVKERLTTDAGRFHALKLAILVETTDGAAARTLLDSARPISGVQVGAAGSLAFLANDEAALTQALAAVVPSSAATQTHALELLVDPALVAKGIAQVPLLDAIQNPALAGLLAFGTELGPLLGATEAVTAWLDPAAHEAHRGQLTWLLRSEPTP